MADKTIQSLDQASHIYPQDLLVLEQDGAAMSLSGQALMQDLATELDAHGGISDISYTPPVSPSLNGTITITLADETEETFTIANGRGITGISKSSSGLTDTYTLSYNDGTTSSFSVSNGVSISSISKTDTVGLTDIYTITYNNGSTSLFSVNNGNGIDNLTKSSSGLVDTYTLHYDDGTSDSFAVTNGKAISTIEKTGTVDLTDTYTITYNDSTTDTFSVDNGVGIDSITWTSSGVAGDGMTHQGTISYNDGTTSTFSFQDGVKGDTGDQTYVWFKWSQDYPTADTDMQNSAAPYIGVYAGTASSPPTAYTSYSWYQYKGNTGDPGSSIQSIALTSSSDLVDTYTITQTNGNTSNFTVTNAKSITSMVSSQGQNPIPGTANTITVNFNDGDTAQFYVWNGTNGTGSVSTVSGIQADGNGDVPQVASGYGAPTTATVGQKNQLYYDMQNSVLYYCNGENQSTHGTYDWFGSGVTVDSALSGSSTNPVQNAVITNRVGTGALPNNSSSLTDAINYVDGEIPSPASTVPSADTTSGAVGTGTAFARNDHQHPLNVPTSGVPSALGTASQGSAATYSRSDHVHALPSFSDLGLGDVASENIVPISKGGTGGNTANNANVNLQNYNLLNATGLTMNDSLNDCTTIGVYRSNGDSMTSSLTNKPSGLTHGFKMVVMAIRSTSYTMQHIHEWETGNEWKRFASYESDAWTFGSWSKVASSFPLTVADGGTGATDYDTARENLGLDVAYACTPIAVGDVNTQKTISTSLSYCPFLLAINGTNTSRQGFYIVALRKTSATVTTTVNAASDLTVTTGTGSITLKSSSSNCFAYILPLSASVAESLTIS